MATGVPSKAIQKVRGYELSYDGKLHPQQVVGLPAHEPHEHTTPDPRVRLLQGDNLGILLWLRRDRSVHRKVRCVYIDPPFATSMAFVGRDVNHAYTDFPAGADYLEFMRQRLIVLHDLLADDGVIFVHLDQTMVFEVKLILDEVFGRRQFRNFITRKKCNTKNYTRLTFGNVSDHVLFYSKSDKYVWHRPYDPWVEERIREEYQYVDKATGRRYKKVPLHAPGVRNGQTGKPWRGMMPPPGKHWQYPPSKLEALDKTGEIYWSPNGNPRRIVFFDPGKGVPAQDMWLQFKDAHNQNIRITGYPTEKNLDLVSRLVAATTNPRDIVLDAFCGSGTTLEAARELDRCAIGIDASQAAIEATLKRLETGRERMGDFVQARKKRKGSQESQASLFESPPPYRGESRRSSARRPRSSG
jgi:adenine-specific DNA-methyltransferase